MIFTKTSSNKNLECFMSCPKGHLVDSAAKRGHLKNSAAKRGQSFSERMERSEIPQRSEDHSWGFAPVKRRF